MKAEIFLLLCLLAGSAQGSPKRVTLGRDRPSLRVPVSHPAEFECCYICQNCKLDVKWVRSYMISRNTSEFEYIKPSGTNHGKVPKDSDENKTCHFLKLDRVTVNDTALYQCALNGADQKSTVLYTAGTYLQVYEPLRKTLNISESAKNSIITAEGILLLLCVLIPGFLLICKSKGLNELKKKKVKEEENIYEGLNLDDCTSTYHQIQRSMVQGPYQDVANTVAEDIQLEKP